jgi:hypothetical protein
MLYSESNGFLVLTKQVLVAGPLNTALKQRIRHKNSNTANLRLKPTTG